MKMSLEGTLLCSLYHASLLPYFLVDLSSQLPNYSHVSLLFSAICQRPRTFTQACIYLKATARRSLHHSNTELSHLSSPTSLPGTLGRRFEYPGDSLCYRPYLYSSPLLCHLMTSEFTQTHGLVYGFCLAHPILCGGCALSTLGHTVAWVVATYVLADAGVEMWSWWGVHGGRESVD